MRIDLDVYAFVMWFMVAQPVQVDLSSMSYREPLLQCQSVLVLYRTENVRCED